MIKTTFFLFMATCGFSQAKDQEHYKYFATAIDIRNAAIGSAPTNNKPALDLIYQAGIVSHNFEINISYESFNRIHFDKYAIGVGYHFPLYGYVLGKQVKTVLIPSIEPAMIGRWGTEWQTTSCHLTISGALSLRWFLTDHLGVELLHTITPRVDLYARYPELHSKIPMIQSNYLKVIYRIGG